MAPVTLLEIVAVSTGHGLYLIRATSGRIYLSCSHKELVMSVKREIKKEKNRQNVLLFALEHFRCL